MDRLAGHVSNLLMAYQKNPLVPKSTQEDLSFGNEYIEDEIKCEPHGKNKTDEPQSGNIQNLRSHVSGRDKAGADEQTDDNERCNNTRDQKVDFTHQITIIGQLYVDTGVAVKHCPDEGNGITWNFKGCLGTGVKISAEIKQGGLEIEVFNLIAVEVLHENRHKVGVGI